MAAVHLLASASLAHLLMHLRSTATSMLPVSGTIRAVGFSLLRTALRMGLRLTLQAEACMLSSGRTVVRDPYHHRHRRQALSRPCMMGRWKPGSLTGSISPPTCSPTSVMVADPRMISGASLFLTNISSVKHAYMKCTDVSIMLACLVRRRRARVRVCVSSKLRIVWKQIRSRRHPE